MTDTTGPKPRRQSEALPQDAATAHSPSSSDEPVTISASRYGVGRTGMSRGRRIGLGATGLLVLSGVVGYIGWQQANPAITGTVLRYTSDNKSVSVTFEVDKPSGRAASCTISAMDVHGVMVGSVDVPVPAGRGRNIVSYVLSTTAPPDSVLVQSCSLMS